MSAADAPSIEVPDPTQAAGSGPEHVALGRDDVAHLAHLARLQLTENELDLYVGQLSVILDSVTAVSRVAGPDVEPTTHAVPLDNVYRDDVIQPGLTHEQALDQAPAADEGRFRVPQILADEL